MSDMEEDKDSLSRTLAFDRGHGYAQKDYDAMRDREEFGGGSQVQHAFHASTHAHPRPTSNNRMRQTAKRRTDGRTDAYSSFQGVIVVVVSIIGGRSARRRGVDTNDERTSKKAERRQVAT